MTNKFLSRLVEECRAVGLDAKGINSNNELFFGEEPNPELLALVENAHIPRDDIGDRDPYFNPDYITYISTDLESYPPAQALKAYITDEQWQAYLAIQTSLIKNLRASAYQSPIDGSDGLRDQYLADELTKEEWLAKRQEVKDRYPWPGNYR